MSVKPRLLGALPVVHAYLRRLGWPQLLEPFIRHAAYRQALDLLVKSVLLKPSALYRIGSWAQDHDPAYRPAQHLSDDGLARALDQLFNADRASLLTALIVRAVQVFQIDTSQIHNDSTSVKFSGAYEQQNPKGLQLLHGFSKDHRPDLNNWSTPYRLARTERFRFTTKSTPATKPTRGRARVFVEFFGWARSEFLPERLEVAQALRQL